MLSPWQRFAPNKRVDQSGYLLYSSFIVSQQEISMNYVVYHKDTTRYLCNHPKVRTTHTSFPVMKTAKAALTREVNRGAVKREDFLIADVTSFASIEKTETVNSLMTGSPIKQSVNTPMCCDPSTETYWSM
jgi:hypothetical protein